MVLCLYFVLSENLLFWCSCAALALFHFVSSNHFCIRAQCQPSQNAASIATILELNENKSTRFQS